MFASESENKVLGTRLIQNFGGRLKDWADELQKCQGTIVAISRKGPRLIELMVREGFLPESILSRVIAEQALPFLTYNNKAGFVVVDDAMTYGTTFNRIFKLAEQAGKRCGRGGIPTGIPFAVGQDANYRELITKYFLDLSPDQITPLVNNEMLAFRLLGKPYDVEHPMLTWIGDFSDTIELEATLKKFTDILDGQIITIGTSVPTVAGNVPICRWTILLPPCSFNNIYTYTDYRKLRIYLNPEKDKLVVAAMCPLSLSKANMDSLGEILPEPLNHLWEEMSGKIYLKSETEIDGRMAIAGSHSLSMWANFLLATIFLRETISIFEEAFETTAFQPRMYGPHREDLRYLVGPDLCLHVESIIAQFLECVDLKTIDQPFNYAAEIKGEKIPSKYAENYKKKLSSLLDNATEVKDVLQAIFYAQHSEIEVPSRNDNKNNGKDDSERLEFGITYSTLHKTVLEIFPDASEKDIHECLDKLIDDGAIVPRYVNMAASDNSIIWVRTFRVGEGSVMRTAHTVRMLFDKLSTALNEKEIPPVLFEKYCVLALCVAKDIPDLHFLHSSDDIEKSFHLYGARAALRQKNKTVFLSDWAVTQGILIRNNGKNFGFSEMNGSYSLQQDIDKLYPKHECPWDNNVKDRLEDLASLVAAIYKKYKTKPLIALTSTASENDLQRALEAELKLWLYDRTASINNGLIELSKLTAKTDKNNPKKEQELEDVNKILSKMANFTAQSDIKLQLAEKIQDIYNNIDELTEELLSKDKNIKRIWRDLRPSLGVRSKSKDVSSGLCEIESTILIVHVTTRVIRELLTLAGFKNEQSKEHSIGLEESLKLLHAKLEVIQKNDPVTGMIFADIIPLITIIKNQPLDNFNKAFSEVRSLILRIVERCEQMLENYGIDQKNEKFEILPQPRFIMMWDIIKSTEVKDRSEIEPLIIKANKQIAVTLKGRILGFDANSKNDSNSFVCEDFTDVLTAFQILNQVFRIKNFRAGCVVNLQGEIKYYPKSKGLGGRAHEYAARIMTFFKEVNDDKSLWSGILVPSEPNRTNYLIVNEFAMRYAQDAGTWPVNETSYMITKFDGTFKSRVYAALPVTLSMLQINEIKSTELHGKQQELI